MPKPPHWRLIESALLAVLADYGIETTEERGERYVELRQGTAPTVEYRVSDLAKELEKRL